MKISLAIGLLGVLLVSNFGSGATIVASGEAGRAPGNPFDYANLSVNSNTSLIGGDSPLDAFGAALSSVETGHTIFDQAGTSGTPNTIFFTTNSPVTISGYSLYLSEDGPNGLNRETTSFVLLADKGSGLVPISTVSNIGNGTTYFTTYGGDTVTVSDSFAPVLASKFELEFTGNGSGERIDQINAVPEPATVGLIAFGALGLLARRHQT